MNWRPADVIRLVALVGAFVLAAIGALLTWYGVGAEGIVDIKSTVLSGSIKSASAGLFIVFFAFGIIIYVLASLSAEHVSHASLGSSPSKNIGRAFWGVLIALVASGALGASGYGSGFGLLAAFLGYMLFLVGIAYLASLDAK